MSQQSDTDNSQGNTSHLGEYYSSQRSDATDSSQESCNRSLGDKLNGKLRSNKDDDEFRTEYAGSDGGRNDAPGTQEDGFTVVLDKDEASGQKSNEDNDDDDQAERFPWNNTQSSQPKDDDEREFGVMPSSQMSSVPDNATLQVLAELGVSSGPDCIATSRDCKMTLKPGFTLEPGQYLLLKAEFRRLLVWDGLTKRKVTVTVLDSDDLEAIAVFSLEGYFISGSFTAALHGLVPPQEHNSLQRHSSTSSVPDYSWSSSQSYDDEEEEEDSVARRATLEARIRFSSPREAESWHVNLPDAHSWGTFTLENGLEFSKDFKVAVNWQP